MLKKRVKIVHWNCFRYDSSKQVELERFIDKFKPDIISLQEVKFNQEQANLFLRFDSYIVYYKPRQRNPTKGGGVALLIKNSILNTRIFGLDENLEIIGVKIEAGNFPAV